MCLFCSLTTQKHWRATLAGRNSTREGQVLIFLCWVNEEQGRVQRGYGKNSWSLQCWGNTYSTWRSSQFSSARNQKFAPLLFDCLRDLAEYTSKTEKGQISVSAHALHAATSSTAWLPKFRRKLKQKSWAKNAGKTSSENLKLGLFRRTQVVWNFHFRFSPQPSAQAMRLRVSRPANQGKT